jgi:hypothetical protein
MLLQVVKLFPHVSYIFCLLKQDPGNLSFQLDTCGAIPHNLGTHTEDIYKRPFSGRVTKQHQTARNAQGTLR